MNHPIHWLYSQHGGMLTQGVEHCYLCGVATPAEQSVQKGIADTFNSHYLAKCPSSPWLCAACSWYFDSKAAHPDFRKMSLMVWETGWKQWERATMKADIEGTLSHGTGEDVYLVCSLSKKKHILLQAPLNAHGSKLLAIQVEERVAYVDQTTWNVLNHSFMALLALGHGKGEILSGDFYASTLRKHGQIKTAIDHSRMLEAYRHSPTLELLSYVTIIEDRKDEDGTVTHRDGTDSLLSSSPQSRMEPNRPGVQGEVPHGHLDAGRDERGGVRTHEQQPAEVSQQSLW